MLETFRNRLITGDCIGIMNQMPEKSVHCVVTSPPYFGLRNYQSPVTVWGGDANCTHNWTDLGTRKSKWDKPDPAEIIGYRHNKVCTFEASMGQTCSKCGAWAGALGQEPSIDMFVSNLVDVFRDVYRILRDDGVAWMVIGDSHAGSWGNYGRRDGQQRPLIKDRYVRKAYEDGVGYHSRPPTVSPDNDIKDLNVCGVPWRTMLSLQDAGWIVRAPVIWAKGESYNPEWSGAVMPHPHKGTVWERHRVKISGDTGSNVVKMLNNKDHHSGLGEPRATWIDCPGCPKCEKTNGLVLSHGNWRPTSAYEVVLMLIKQSGAYTDGIAVEETAATGDDQDDHRNLRDVWSIGTKGFAGAHFATFPEALVEPMIKLSTSDRGHCPTCGAAWARVVESTVIEGFHGGQRKRADAPGSVLSPTSVFRTGNKVVVKTVGWRPTCNCVESNPVPAIVYDPFMGSGTVAVVARRLGRDYCGSDINQEYVDIAKQRIEDDQVFPGVGLF